jgi:hypothetical protein
VRILRRFTSTDRISKMPAGPMRSRAAPVFNGSGRPAEGARRAAGW